MDLFYFYDSCDESRTVYLVYLLVNITSGYKLALLKIAPDDWKACTAVCIEVVEIQNYFKYYHITKYTKAMWRTLSQMKNSGKPGNTRYWGNPPYGLSDDKCFVKFGNITAIINIAISIHFFCLTKVHLLLFPWWTEDLFWSKQVSRTHLLLLGWRGNSKRFCWTLTNFNQLQLTSTNFS